MLMRKYLLSVHELPVDLFADPDGPFTYEALVSAAGLDPESTPPPLVAALAAPWDGHPEGAAVVLGAEGETGVAFVLEMAVMRPEVRAA